MMAYKKLVILIIVPLVAYIAWPQPKTFSLWQTLDHYGYKTEHQKKALEYFLQKAEIIAPGQDFHDRFPQRAHKNELFQDIIAFIQLTQKRFVIRQGTQERWEVGPADWMHTQSPESITALKTLGVVSEISPAVTNPDVICVLGSALKSMVKRFNYLATLHIQPKQLVLLAGQRKVTIDVDGTAPELNKLAQKQGLSSWDQLTETHLIQESYQASALYNKFPMHVIDTPAGNLPRPTTETTILEFIKWLKQHPEVQSVIFVSNQPFVGYQKAVIAEVFRHEKVTTPFEVIGAEVEPPLNIQKLVEAVGSSLWAKTPAILSNLDMQAGDEQTVAQLKELYANQPLIYHNVERLFK